MASKRYGKILSDGVLEYAPSRLHYNGRWYINPKPSILKAAGYKPVRYGDMPTDYADNEDIMESYVEHDDYIEVVYEIYSKDEDEEPEEIED